MGLVRVAGMARGRSTQYVNDRPYVASSFLSVAIARVFGTALAGRCQDKPDVVERPLPLVARLAVLPCRGGEGLLRRLSSRSGTTFTPSTTRSTPRSRVGRGPLLHRELRSERTLADLLTHLYVSSRFLTTTSTTSSDRTRWKSCCVRVRAGWPDIPRRT